MGRAAKDLFSSKNLLCEVFKGAGNRTRELCRDASKPALVAALNIALLKGDKDAVKALINKGAEIDETATFLACASGNLSIVEMFDDRYAEFSDDDVKVARLNGHAEIADFVQSRIDEEEKRAKELLKQ